MPQPCNGVIKKSQLPNCQLRISNVLSGFRRLNLMQIIQPA